MPSPDRFVQTDGNAKSLEKVQVMVLDSSEHSRQLIKNLLANFGFTNITVANDGNHGVQILRKQRIDIIFTDCELKVYRNATSFSDTTEELMEVIKISGIEFVKRLRHSPASPNPFIPVVMLVDMMKPDDLYKARDAGVDEVIVKPIKAQIFCDHIISVIDSSRIFITAETYKGPCRRRQSALPADGKERRKREIRIIRRSEHAKK